MEVKFRNTTLQGLNTLEKLEGQIIAIVDAPGYYYDHSDGTLDANGNRVVTRYPASQKIHVTTLPSEGMEDMLYIVTAGKGAGAYIWDGNKFVCIANTDTKLSLKPTTTGTRYIVESTSTSGETDQLATDSRFYLAGSTLYGPYLKGTTQVTGPEVVATSITTSPTIGSNSNTIAHLLEVDGGNRIFPRGYNGPLVIKTPFKTGEIEGISAEITIKNSIETVDCKYMFGVTIDEGQSIQGNATVSGILNDGPFYTARIGTIDGCIAFCIGTASSTWNQSSSCELLVNVSDITINKLDSNPDVSLTRAWSLSFGDTGFAASISQTPDPAGTTTRYGLTKLYTGLGENTDGTMTQKAIKEAINSLAHIAVFE